MLKLIVALSLLLPTAAMAQQGRPVAFCGEVHSLIRASLVLKAGGSGIQSDVVREDEPVSILMNSRVADPHSYLSGVISDDLFEPDKRQSLQDSLAGAKTRNALKVGFFSLIIPGAGQLYSGNIVKAAAFFGVEFAAWIVNVVYNKKGSDETKAFQLYADGTAAENYQNGHYSVVRYAEWIQKNLPELMSQQGTSPANQTIANEYAPLIVINNGKPAPWDQINWNALNQVEVAIGGYFSHWLFVYPNVEYYKEIGKYPQFRQGWDDENPALLDYNSLRNDTPHSAYFENMRGTATGFYSVGLAAAGAIIANHFVSAVEATIWAHSHFRPVETNIKVSRLPYGGGYQTTLALAVHF